MKRIRLPLFILACISIPSPSYAYDWLTNAKVTLIEATYAPNSIPFQVDRAIGNCAAGSMLTWTSKGGDAASKAQNFQAVFALLLTAQSSGQLVTIYGNNVNCSIDYIYIIK